MLRGRTSLRPARMTFAGPHKTSIRLTAKPLAMLGLKRMLDEDIVAFGLWYACQSLLTSGGRLRQLHGVGRTPVVPSHT